LSLITSSSPTPASGVERNRYAGFLLDVGRLDHGVPGRGDDRGRSPRQGPREWGSDGIVSARAPLMGALAKEQRPRERFRFKAPGQGRLTTANAVFIDACSDLAVLGSPHIDHGQLNCDKLTNELRPLVVRHAPWPSNETFPLSLVTASETCVPRYAEVGVYARTDSPTFQGRFSSPVFGGMSGSPVLDRDGCVVGIVSSSDDDSIRDCQMVRLPDALPGWVSTQVAEAPEPPKGQGK
jgi:hypothetical protein